MSKPSGALCRRGGKRKENLQLRLWNLNSTSNFPVAPHQLSCQISANQHEAEMSVNVNKHWKTCAKGNDVITNVISTNQHFTWTFLMQIFKFQRGGRKLSFLFLPCRQCSQATPKTSVHRFKVESDRNNLALTWCGRERFMVRVVFVNNNDRLVLPHFLIKLKS